MLYIAPHTQRGESTRWREQGERITVRWRPFLQGAKILKQKVKLKKKIPTLWFPVSIKAPFFPLLVLAKF